MDQRPEIAVVGAGIAGLTCAYRLQQAGRSVEVFEREEKVGGRMRTRVTGGMAFDLGANFLVAAYSHLLELTAELGVELECLSPVAHLFYRAGSWHSMNMANLRDVVRMDGLNFWDRFRLLEFFYTVHRRYPKLDFFDLSNVPEEFNRENAYDLALETVGQGFADYIVDAFHSCMMFYRARETSVAAFLALFQTKTAPGSDFSIFHAKNEMQQIADALAGRVRVHTGTAVQSIRRVGEGWEIRIGEERKVFRYLVLATTANVAHELLKEGPSSHLDLLRGTRYAGTVNLSFVMDKEALGDAHCFYIPYVESPLVAEFTNEALKGENVVREGKSLCNVGLHEAAALELSAVSDEDLFSRVERELQRLKPDIGELAPHDLERWSQAIPKYDAGHIARVKQFLSTAQGEDGLYLCGDYMNAPWLEGASRCGTRVAEAIKERLQTSSPVIS